MTTNFYHVNGKVMLSIFLSHETFILKMYKTVLYVTCKRLIDLRNSSSNQQPLL